MSRTSRDRRLKGVVIVLVVIAVAGVVLLSGTFERLLPQLPVPSAGGADPRLLATVFVAAVPVVVLVRLARLGRSAAAAEALERSGAEPACAARTRPFVDALAELYDVSPRTVARRLGPRFVVRADAEGVGFWGGGRKPQRFLLVPWAEVRTVRSDTMPVGERSESIMQLRVRRAGASVEVPVLLTSRGRGGAFPLRGDAFTRVVRQFKSAQRDYLVSSGLTWEEAVAVAPVTAPIPVITPGLRSTLERPAAAAARR